MTNLEELRQEIKKQKLGISTDSKWLVKVLELITGADGKYSDMDRLEKEIISLKLQIKAYKHDLETLKAEARGVISPTQEYIDKFFKALEECETPEGKDALKKAQMFVNTVNIDTKYDNTAFIYGLASILTQSCAPLDELKKVNPKLEVTWQETEKTEHGSIKKAHKATPDGIQSWRY